MFSGFIYFPAAISIIIRLLPNDAKRTSLSRNKSDQLEDEDKISS